ncbi:hypothetical protein [Agrococcus sp. Marseille-Q4369]|uniref:hypothetical protein n=1 Tax=Agrococcus sp. Marseille-Q4369 TaxID=2810513 RepID=UPI001B8D2D45|nr:hypothetical protein [Agrococcus sp. Marseille-Q4369]QUW18645.1 hypothetical protein JSQ78_12780 [Agrococcus sp. Marseille-Q4369]
MDHPVVSSFAFMRAGTLHAEAERKLSQSVSEALSTAAAGTTLLALCDDEGGITRLFVSFGDNAENRAFRFATSLNASPTPHRLPEDLTRQELRCLAWVSGRSSVESGTRASTDLQAVADAIDTNLLPGDWVAMSVRAPAAATLPELRTHPTLNGEAPEQASLSERLPALPQVALTFLDAAAVDAPHVRELLRAQVGSIAMRCG